MSNSTAPKTTDVQRLILLIHAAAANEIAPQDFMANFRKVHEQIENEGRPRYESQEQARLIWDVLWEVEFYENPSARIDDIADPTPKPLEEIMQLVKKTSGRLKELAEKK